MSDVGIGTGKVVVNRAMSLDGFIAGPGHAMDWIFEYLTADALPPEVMAATGAMLIGRGTYEVAKRMADQDTTYDGGAQFVLTHEPPDEPDPTVTFLTCGLEEAVAAARSAAGDKNLEILGADVAAQCLERGLVDEILVYVLPVLLGDGVRFSPPSLGRIDLEPLSNTQSGAVTMLRFRVRKLPRSASQPEPVHAADELPSIGAPATRALAAAEITRLSQLTEHRADDLLELHGMGPRAIAVLREVLSKHGLSFRDEA